jgi:hypothetical protein
MKNERALKRGFAMKLAPASERAQIQAKACLAQVME